MFEERTQQRLLRSAFSQRSANSFGQMLRVVGNKVGQIDIFGSVPNLLVGVKVGRVCRKPFDGNSLFESPNQSPGRTAVYHPAIPNQNNAFRKVIQQCCNKKLGLVNSNIMVGQPEIKPHPSIYWRNTDCRDSREPVSSNPTMLDRSFAARRPCASDDRLKHKAAFVNENNGFTAFSGVFLYSASRRCARWPQPLRCVREPVVPAFDNSTPFVSANARRRRGRILRQSVFGSQQLLAAMSKDRLHTRVFRGLAAEALQVSLTGRRLAWEDDRYEAWLSDRRDHTGDMPPSTAKQHRVLRRNAWLPLNMTNPVSATPWPRADAAPCSCMTLCSSYKILSSKSYCANELFNSQ